MERIIEEYIVDKNEALLSLFLELFEVVKGGVDEASQMMIQYGMPSFSVPLSLYPEGYLGNLDQPLTYVSLAIQKNYVSLYNMCFMNLAESYVTIIEDYEKRIGRKISRGKSCVRFKVGTPVEKDLILELIQIMSVKSWIELNRELKR